MIGAQLIAETSTILLEEFLAVSNTLADEAQADVDDLPNQLSDLEQIQLIALAATALIGGLGFVAMLMLLRSRRDLIEGVDRERRRFTALVESIGLGVYEVNRNGIIQYVNPAGARATRLRGR